VALRRKILEILSGTKKREAQGLVIFSDIFWGVLNYENKI